MNGVVIRVISQKGFGFIKGEDHLEYFFHYSGLRGWNWENVRQGDAVTFTVNVGSTKGPRAEDVAPA